MGMPNSTQVLAIAAARCVFPQPYEPISNSQPRGVAANCCAWLNAYCSERICSSARPSLPCTEKRRKRHGFERLPGCSSGTAGCARPGWLRSAGRRKEQVCRNRGGPDRQVPAQKPHPAADRAAYLGTSQSGSAVDVVANFPSLSRLRSS